MRSVSNLHRVSGNYLSFKNHHYGKKKDGRVDRMHFLVRMENEFNLLRQEVDEPYSNEEIYVMRRIARVMRNIAEGSRGKKKKR